MANFTLLTTEGAARRGRFETVHGTIETPVFMNVATAATIRGGVSAPDLADLQCQVMLCNTYHLHVRPGEKIIHDMGGLQGFTGWKGPTLTDSGGFQVFSLAHLRKITEEGVAFNSHVDGRKIFMGPEESMAIQVALGSTIAMAFDECLENPSTYEKALVSSKPTVRWLERCKIAHDELVKGEQVVNPRQLLFGINQGSTFDDIRIDHMKTIAALDLDGYAIGGLAVGETTEEMYRIIEAVESYMPVHKPRYLMGVGTCSNILEAVARGVDFFDCVMPSRNARHGHLCTMNGVLNLNNKRYEKDPAPIDKTCECPTCRNHSRAYLRHLLRANELLYFRLAVQHNLYFYNNLMVMIRNALDNHTFSTLRDQLRPVISKRI